MTTPDPLETMTIKDVCRLLKVTRKTAYRILVSWRVRIVRDGRIVRIFRSDFEAAVAKNTGHW